MSQKFFSVTTPDLDAAAHAAGDTLFLPVAINALQKGFRGGNDRAILRSLVYSISAAVDLSPVLYIFSSTPVNALGAVNQPFNLLFADTSKILGRLSGTPVIPVGAGRQWTFPASNDAMYIPLKADNGTSIFIAAATTGTPAPGAACNSRLNLIVEYLK